MLPTLVRLLRAEGFGSVCRRLADRCRYRFRGSRLSPIAMDGRVAPALSSPVLHLLASSASPWWGGVEALLVERRELESAHQPFALLVPEKRRFRLELRQGNRRFTKLMEVENWSTAVPAAARLLGSEVLHVENLAGFEPGVLLSLARDGWPLVISLHDFAAFSPRPNLIEQPAQTFCGYSQDFARCGRCLGLPPAVPEARRRVAAELLAGAAALVFGSDFARREHQRLFPGLAEERLHVLPAVAAPRPIGKTRTRRACRLRVAFLGSVQPHKGSHVFRDVVASFSADQRRQLSFSAYGSGEPSELHALRRLGVEIRGYFRLGSLPRLLARDEIDVGLLLSIFPETYCRVFDDCREAGVPVLAFDFAALGERLRRHGGGWLVEPAAGAAGVAALLRAILQGTAPEPAPATAEPWPELGLQDLYERARREKVS